MTSVTTGSDRARKARRDRHDALYALRKLSTLNRVKGCGARRIDASKGVGVHHSPDTGAYFSNLQHCGSVWACPVCSAKINQTRAEEVTTIGTRHLEAGGQALLLTHTVPHDQGDDLAHLLATIAGTWKELLAHRGYQEDKATYGITGFIRSLEITHGINGWHPHLHIVVLVDLPLSPEHVDNLRQRFHDRWATAITRAGYRLPHDTYGTDLQIARDVAQLAHYLTDDNGKQYIPADHYTIDTTKPALHNLALELTRHDLKASRRKGRTPWGILRDFITWGDTTELRLWTEYETATKGHRSLTWSRGLKARYAVEEITDEDAANPTVGAPQVYELTHEETTAVRRRRHAKADLCDALETNGMGAFLIALAGIVREFRAEEPEAPPPDAPGLHLALLPA